MSGPGTKIRKQAAQTERFRRPLHFYKNARTAFEHFLLAAECRPDQKVLLPAYIGWSPREGSGVFDPVAKLRLPYAFYRMNRKLHIDPDHYRAMLDQIPIKVVVIIHYFGFVDPFYEEAVRFAQERGALVLEDEAHALLTDAVTGRSGRLGDACIYSLHKMLPFTSGGALALNAGHEIHLMDEGISASEFPVWDYDLAGIAAVRRRNAILASELVTDQLAGEVTVLWSPDDREVPQTLPVLIHNVSRFKLYELMNERGFGVVALYHTLIDALSRNDFPDSFYLADRIMNLPVHQDVDEVLLAAMIHELANCIAALSAAAK